MGWVRKNDDDYGNSSGGDVGEFRGFSSSNEDGGRCATRKVVKSQCHTEEVEPGKFVRKCEKTEQVFKDCVGRPTEMVQSNKEYTEEDVTDQMVQGSFPFKSAQNESPFFPGLRSDIESIERDLFSRVDEFFEAAQALKNEFFNSVRVPADQWDNEVPSRYKNPGIHVEGGRPEENFADGDIDVSGLSKDV